VSAADVSSFRRGLASKKLNGTLPPELGSLTRLTSLDLNSNNISGTVPPAYGSLRELTSLCVSQRCLRSRMQCVCVCVCVCVLPDAAHVGCAPRAQHHVRQQAHGHSAGSVDTSHEAVHAVRDTRTRRHAHCCTRCRACCVLRDVQARLCCTAQGVHGRASADARAVPLFAPVWGAATRAVRCSWLSANRLSGSIHPHIGKATGMRQLCVTRRRCSHATPTQNCIHMA
jgi:hypothetical protein